MSSLYYTMRDAKIRIAQELMNRGWNVFGYHADESDSMTDYYSPAYWGGLAEKNGFVLVIDRSYNSKGEEIKKYNPKASLSFADRSKIEKLEAMTQERGATAGEEANAKAMIEKIKMNVSNEIAYEVIGKIPGHLANPGKCKWHIEKDGVIYDKGTGISKYSNIPDEYRFDINTMQYKESYKYYSTWEDGEYVHKENTITEEERKVINEFKSLILRFERIVNGMNTMGDGTKETESAAMEQMHNEKLEKVIVKETKKVSKMVEVTDRKNIQVGDYLTFNYHGGFWLVTDAGQKTGTWKGEKKTKNTFHYESVGKASRGYQQIKNARRYYQWEDTLIKEIEAGTTKLYELKEVEETIETEKWIRVNQPKQTKQSLHKEEVKENTNTVKAEEINNITVTMNEEKKGIEIKFAEKPAQEIINSLKENGFWWLKSKSIWCAKQTPERIEFANSLISVKTEEVKEEPQQQEESPYEPEFKPGYYYNIHFKEYNFTITELKQQLTELYIIAEKCGNNKLSVIGADYETVLKVKEISDKNGSILFIDAEFNQEDINTVNTITHISNQIIDKYELYKMAWTTSEQYKVELLEQLKIKQLNINISVLEYLHYSLPELEKVVKSLLESENTNSNIENLYNSDEVLNQVKNTTEAATDEEKNNNDNGVIEMSSILNKFNNIKIKNTERISQEDKEFCEMHMKAYKETLNCYKEFLNRMVIMYNEQIATLKNYDGNKISSYSLYVNNYGDFGIRKLVDTILQLQDNFISTICNYFSNKHKISIDGNEIYDKYKSKELPYNSRENNDGTFKNNLIEYVEFTYNNIIDEIFLQLGGFTFEEKAIEELKDSTRSIYYYNDYRKSSNMQIKNNKLIIDGYYAYKDSIWNEYRLKPNSQLFSSLCHFDSGIITNDSELHNKYCGYRNEKNSDNYDKYIPKTLTKITGIKFFKNGKLEIEFSSSQYAEYFAKEYCGYKLAA